MPHSRSDSKSWYDNYDVNVNDDDIVVDNDDCNSESDESLLLIDYANKIIIISLRYLIMLHTKMLFIFVVVLYDNFFTYVFIKQITVFF